jgi:hypothetical protein
MKDFRVKDPIRSTGVPVKKDYRAYRDQLATDFNGKCGYTDCNDRWWGVKFQVDHFAPQNPDIEDGVKKQKFLDMATNYTNLVYSCPQINRAKSNDWASDDPLTAILDDKGYFDPCDNFNDHFHRTDDGAILPNDGDVIAQYMWTKLKLYLQRYQIYWRLEELYQNQRKLLELRKKDWPEAERNQINNAIADLAQEISDYFAYLGTNHNSVV